MRIAVTGATGFVGRHVVAELEGRGFSVIIASRSADRSAPFRDRHRVVDFDLAEPGRDPFAALGAPDMLFHLAWGGLPNYRSRHHFEDELPAQYRFLRAMVEGGLGNLLVTGTCFEYGLQSGALHEGLQPAPTNPYGHAKDALRAQLTFLRRDDPFNLTWARLFYAFGPGQAPTSLYTQLRNAAAGGAPAFNMSGGEQLRDYLPIAEMARLIVVLGLERRDLGVVNVCSGQPISVRRLVEGWLAANDWELDLNLGRHPYPADEPMAFWGDRRKLDACLRSCEEP